MYPPLPLLSGLYYLVLARLYWGRMYLYGLGFYLLALTMKLGPRWAPLEFGSLYALSHVAIGFILRHHAKNASKESAPRE